MSARYEMPLTSGDLREIAKLVDRTQRLLFTKDGTFKADELSFATTGLWTIPVLRPDIAWRGKDIDIIGHLMPEDGWLGFVPLGEEND